MAKFNKGDKVRVFKGIHEGTTGVVADPWWQVSQSDWPRVEFTTGDGMYFYADEDEMELTEDPYEYNVEYTDLITGTVWLYRSLWEPNADWLKKKMAEAEANVHKLDYTSRLVKRRKAGPVEDAT